MAGWKNPFDRYPKKQAPNSTPLKISTGAKKQEKEIHNLSPVLLLFVKKTVFSTGSGQFYDPVTYFFQQFLLMADHQHTDSSF